MKELRQIDQERTNRVPVRVRLRRINAISAKVLPPFGEEHGWWQRLKSALGTKSNAFVSASLCQLQLAARLPGGGISEMAVNSALAIVEAAQPQNEVEAALAVQMAATHSTAMAILGRLGDGHVSERRAVALGSAVSRLLRAYTLQVETLRRLKNGSYQSIRVEHVHVNAGANAVVGQVTVT